MTTAVNERLEAALARAAAGEPVLMVWWTDQHGNCACDKGTTCESPGKHPITLHGLDDATTNAETLRKWWSWNPPANVAVRCDLIARIDIDNVEVADALAQDGGLRMETELVRTPRGGLHIAYRTPEPVRGCVLYLAGGTKLGDFKAARGYVLVPPSSVRGRAYERLSPGAVEPATESDPLERFRQLLPAFGYQLGKRQERAYTQLTGTVHEGEGRHSALVSYAGKVWIAGMTAATLVGLLQVMNESQCDPPLPEDELLAIAHHFIEQRTPRPLTVPTGVLRFPCTDAGNAELFAALNADRLRYDHRMKQWFVWRGEWWSEDSDSSVLRLATESVRERFLRAADFDDTDARAKEAKWATQSESRQRLEALLTLAKADKRLALAGDEWDRDPFLLGVRNGVLDLRTGALRPGQPGDLITKHNDIDYDPDALCPRWAQFLEQVFLHRGPLIDYIQRAVGYSLTGDTSEQDVFACFGRGSNGKTVFLNVLAYLVGHYGWNAPFSMFEAAGRYSIPNDLAMLPGLRVVTASETNEGSRLNEARLKSLTGEDIVTARHLHGAFFTFRPSCKIWLGFNHRPQVNDDSDGFWRRLKLIPFERQFKKAEANPYLLQELVAELPGILAWAVRGCLAWQAGGRLLPPACVVDATDRYRDESDPFTQFLREECTEAPHLVAEAEPLFREYRRWCDHAGVQKPLNLTEFGRRMGDRYQGKRTNHGKLYYGVSLRWLAEEQEEAEGVTGR